MSYFKASLSPCCNVKPVFCKPHPVPFALKEVGGEELNCLEDKGILEHMSCSDWAALVVPVPKGDGHIKICGDYKVTVSSCLKLDNNYYLVPN